MTDSKRLYADFHVIQTVPPSCVNRDDTARPKTATYGGTTRARVSSQSWKRAIREYFKEIFSDSELGIRTKHVPQVIADRLSEKGVVNNPESALKKAEEALTNAGIKISKDSTTGALFFISSKQTEKLAELISEGEKDKKKYKAALQSSPSIDMALFGRMVAEDAELNVDASCQVAHAISTHEAEPEYDYFTAIDDYSPSENAGAGHLGTLEFTSATLYRYATVNIAALAGLIGSDDVPEVLKGFAKAFIFSMPTGKQNSYANRTLPDLVYVTVRTDQPVNLCGAFEKALTNRNSGGFAEKSAQALFDYAEKIYADYCGAPKASFVIGHDGISGAKNADKTDVAGLLNKLGEIRAVL